MYGVKVYEPEIVDVTGKDFLGTFLKVVKQEFGTNYEYSIVVGLLCK